MLRMQSGQVTQELRGVSHLPGVAGLEERLLVLGVAGLDLAGPLQPGVELGAEQDGQSRDLQAPGVLPAAFASPPVAATPTAVMVSRTMQTSVTPRRTGAFFQIGRPSSIS